MVDKHKWITVGKLVAPQGLKGEIRVNPSSDFPERFTQKGNRWLQKGTEAPKPIKLISGRQLPGKSIYIVRFLGIPSRTAAEKLIGQNLLVEANHRPELLTGEFHLLDLVKTKY